MKYTRKPPQTREVTFRVSWVDQPITMLAVNSMPTEALVPLARDDNPEPIINAMPDEISTLLTASSGQEFQEFMKSWGAASEEDDRNAARTKSIFERLIRGLS